MPMQYKELDAEVRKLVSKELERGKVDFNLNIDSVGEESKVSINKSIAQTYFKELESLRDQLGDKTSDLLPLVMRMPDIYETGKEELESEEKEWIFGLIKDALDKLNQFRRKEGAELEEEFNGRIGEIRSLLNDVPQYEDQRVQVIRERMKKGLEEIDGAYDENRFEQEMIYYLEKLDISEEKMRLSNHLDYFEETMQNDHSGKKLGFICQEIGREINTLGSKSNQADMQKLVIGMKDALEKIKEQILNTL